MFGKRSFLLGIATVIVCVGLSALFVSMKRAPKEKKISKKEIIVPVQEIKNQVMNLFLPVVGNLEAQAKVDVYAEVSGLLKVTDKAFLEGVSFRKNEVLLSINDDTYRSEVISRRSSFMNKIASILPDLKYDYPESYPKWENYLKNFDVKAMLKPIPEVLNEKEKYYLAGKSIYTDYYSIKSLETTLRKYEIRAPFAGEVVESDIKPGTLVRSGQKLGEFVDPTKYDLVVGVDLNSLHGIQLGNKVRVYSQNISREWEGEVRRIANKIDSKTQMVQLYIAVSGDNLKEGMFLNAEIAISGKEVAVELPRKLLVDSNQLYLIEDGKAVLKAVDIIQRKDESVIVKGLEDGSLLALKNSSLHQGIEVTAVSQEVMNAL